MKIGNPIDPRNLTASLECIKKELREELSRTVREAKELKIPIIVLFEGWGASGKGYMIEKLISELDPRGFKVWSIKDSTEDELRYPMLYRFWQKVPSAGKMSIFDRSWYREVSISRVEKNIPSKKIDNYYRDIAEFERQLCDDGCIIIKVFLQISKREQARRFEALEASPGTGWRVNSDDHRRHREYDTYKKAFAEMIDRTDTDAAPWYVLDAEDKKETAHAVVKLVLDRLNAAIAIKKSASEILYKSDLIDYDSAEKTHTSPLPAGLRVSPDIIPRPIKKLDEYDLSLDISEEDYKRRLGELQDELFILHNKLYKKKVPLIIAFEGWDAAGKGGAIKRLTAGLDPRGFEVVPISAPTSTELSYQYMRRFWLALPRSGHIGIFDRSWYGRVMVERLEGFAKVAEWTRAFDEMNKFERTLVDNGAIVMKFWLQIDQDEQLRRFNERMENPDKQWKITDEDWRNRDKALGYHICVDQMLQLTNTEWAPWFVVEANSKKFARIKVLETVVAQIKDRL